MYWRKNKYRCDRFVAKKQRQRHFVPVSSVMVQLFPCLINKRKWIEEGMKQEWRARTLRSECEKGKKQKPSWWCPFGCFVDRNPYPNRPWLSRKCRCFPSPGPLKKQNGRRKWKNINPKQFPGPIWTNWRTKGNGEQCMLWWTPEKGYACLGTNEVVGMQ